MDTSLNPDAKRAVKITKTSLVEMVNRVVEELNIKIEREDRILLNEQLEKILEYQLNDIHEVMANKQTLDSPAVRISFREIQNYLSTVKEHIELLENLSKMGRVYDIQFNIRLTELKAIEFDLTEKLLNNRYW
jgi:hypothetical protein